MCNVTVIEFFIKNVEKEEFKDKKILEVGSKYINGSVRPLIERFCSPKEYIGVDIEHGKFVDIILPAEKLTKYFGFESFDVVISTELLEHVKDWRLVITEMKNVLKRGGYIYITTRSKGFPYHAYPYDFWRYETNDLKKIFSDFDILTIEKDPELGVFLKAKKPKNYTPVDLSHISLYSMILGQRTRRIPELREMPLSRKFLLFLKIRKQLF
jgi:SAM-dependent methyltransferase